MQEEAEAHAEEDKKFHELVTARNTADSLIHATEKSLAELGDKVDASEKGVIESALQALKEAVKGDDKDDIEAKTQKLAEASGKLAEKAYADQGGAEAGAGADAAAGQGSGSSAAADEDVVDAEFEEVDDKK